jgi:hypothetical protein
MLYLVEVAVYDDDDDDPRLNVAPLAGCFCPSLLLCDQAR